MPTAAPTVATERSDPRHRIHRRPLQGSRLLAAAIAVSTAGPLAAGESADRDGRPARLADRPRERAEWNAMFREDERGVVDPRNRLRALRQACEIPVDPSMRRSPEGTFSRSDAGPSVSAGAALSANAWQSIGPRPMKSTELFGIQFGNVTGRITALAIHPTNPNVVLLGGATGGIWRSTNAGLTWVPVSDTAPALSISGLSFSPVNPEVVYAATGEADSADLEFNPNRSFGTYLGAGLLKSVDGGSSWTRVDVDLPANSVLSRVLAHPTEAQTVLVGIYVIQDLANVTKTLGGTWISTDGGVHFTRTLAHHVSDLAQDPNAPNTVYAGFGITGGCSNCPFASGVYKSTDFGRTWGASLTAANSTSLLEITGNVKLGVARTNPTTLYASVLSTGSRHSGGGIFRSSDGGATWTKRNVHSDMCGAQCEYNHVILPSSADPDTVYFGAVDLYKSTNGATSWSKVTDVYAGGRADVHVDHHAMAIPPSAPETIYVANDGGLYRSLNGLATTQSLNDTLNLAQFNGVALHPTSTTFAMGGTQDNGNLRYTGALLWTDRTGGDGGANLIRQDDPSKILAANYYAFLNYSTNGGETFDDVTPSGLMGLSNPKESMAFYPPIVAAPNAPGRVFIGSNRVWRNDAFGASGDGWAPRSPASVTTSVITSIGVVGDGAGPLWIGTRFDGVHFSTDGGATFTKRSAGLPNVAVSQVLPASADGLVAYVTLGGFLGLPSRHVFRTVDGGQSWANVSANLPDAPALAVAVNPADPSDLFVATDVGVFRSTNGGAAWTGFNEGLPSANVVSLTFHPLTRDLVAATYGRGVFRVAVGSGATAPTAAFDVTPPQPAPGQSAAFTDRSTGEPTSWLWSFGDGSATSTEKSPRHVYAQAGSYTVTLTATNAAGSNAATKSVVVTAGVANPVTLQVPVVLDVFGVPPSHFTSDLVALSRAAAPTRLSLQYLPAPATPGAGGPRVGAQLSPGRELRLADAIDFFRTSGYAIPASGPLVVGTLRLTFEDVSDASLVFAGSRTSTPNPNGAVGGSFGLFSSATPSAAAPSSTVSLYALREDAAYRSNLAIVDVPPATGTGAPASVSIQIFDGDTGAAVGAPVAHTLQPGEWKQWGSVLRLGSPSVTNGYARISRTGGSNRLLAYGVVNDGPASGGGTSDGSFIASDASAGLVPIVLRARSGSAVFSTELVLANPTTSSATVTLTYTPAAAASGLGVGAGGTRTVSLGAGRQLRKADAVAYLRDELGLPLAPGDGNQGGTLLVQGAVAVARTFNPNPDASVGGTFGLAYSAVSAENRAKTEAWVYGLVQNADARSNLALADARVGDASSVTYVIDVFDTAAGDGATPATAPVLVTLKGGEWYQVNAVLANAGLSNGAVRVRPQSGASDFVVYGVLNDGAAFGSRTSDGSYVAMSGVK